MKRIVLSFIIIFSMASCGGPKALYFWGGASGDTTLYEHLSYNNYDKQTPESICRLIAVFENMIRNQTGLRKMPPPGICAEYGYLLLTPGSADIFESTATKIQKRIFERTDYGAYFKDYGIELLNKEILYYPESEKFIKPLIEKLSNRL